MSKWKRVRLDEIADVRDGTHDTPKRSNIGKKLITSKHIVGGRLDKSSAYLISESDYNAVNKRSKVDKYDILISMIGTVGEVYVEENTPNYAIKNLGLIKTDDRELSLWIKYLWNSWYGINEIEKAKSGTTQQFISLTSLRKMKILLPEKEELLKIVDVLSTYDKLIENNNKRIEILEKTAEEIYKEWFVRMRFPGYENTKFIKGIPEAWEVRKFINKEVKLISSGINKFEGLKRYMATADVEGISLKHGEDITFTERPSRANMQPKENTIWFAKMQDTIKHLYFRNHSQKLIENIILSTGFAGIEFKNINHYYYYLSFIRYGIFEDIKDMYANGSTQVAINNQNIKRIRLLMPDKELLNAFNNIVELNFEMIEKYKEQNQNLIKQRDLLLPRLMNGTIEVK